MAEVCSYTFRTGGGEVTIKGMAEMKAFLALNGVGAIDGAQELEFSNKVQTDTPEFKRWFGDSKVIKPKGRTIEQARKLEIESLERDMGSLSFMEYELERFERSFKEQPDRADWWGPKIERQRAAIAWQIEENERARKKIAELKSGGTPTEIAFSEEPPQPMVMYHATDNPIEGNVFKPGVGGAIYVSPNPSAAEDIVKPGIFNKKFPGLPFNPDLMTDPELLPGLNIIPVYVKAENPFDFNIKTHREALAKHLESIGFKPPAPVQMREDAPDEASGPQDILGMIHAGDYRVIENAESIDWIKKNGFDGFYVQELQEEDEVKNLAVFSSNQLKSAIGNRGTFDPENPDITMSNRSRQSTIGSRFTLPETGSFSAARIKLQDDALRMKRVIEAVKGQGGTVGEAQNFYDANTLMPGRIQAEIDDFKNNIVKPMLDKAVEYDIDLDELSLYAYAKHAEERNRAIARINPRMPDGGSGMKTADAKTILKQVQSGTKARQFEELHKDLMAIASTTRQIMLTEGIITQDEFDALDGSYANYIPLRGLENVDDEGRVRPGIGRGVNIRGAETVRALGRRSRASDLIENVIRDYERVINRVEKNDVGKVLLDFVLSNPDPDLWGVDVERSKPAFNKATGLVQYTKQVEKGEDTIGVKVGGQQVYIKFADPLLARALRQAWKDDVSGIERAVVVTAGWWNNWLRGVLTKYNPAFAAINIPRDALWSGTTAALAELGPKGLARYLAAYGKAMAASTRSEAGVSGTTNVIFGNPQVDRMFQEFRAAGGITGGFYMRSLEDITQDLRNEMLLAGAKGKNPWEQIKSLPPYKLARLTLRGLEFLGASSENATRFALYMAAKESGRTPAQAALLAKNGTTNFNRKGEYGGVLNNLYLFFNAGVQGTAQLAKVLRSPAVAASMAGVAGVGMMLALYGASGGGEDDDGEKYWDKIPSYVKERNLVIMLSPGEPLADGIKRVGKRGRYITIPVQYGFNIFPNMGYMMADVYRNAQDPKRGVTPAKAAVHMASVTFGSINPFGGSVDVTDGVQVLMAVAPTIVDLPLQIVNERSGFGRPSAPAAAPYDRRPDSERMFVSQQGTVPAKIAKTLNELGGGNEAKAGSILHGSGQDRQDSQRAGRWQRGQGRQHPGRRDLGHPRHDRHPDPRHHGRLGIVRRAGRLLGPGHERRPRSEGQQGPVRQPVLRRGGRGRQHPHGGRPHARGQAPGRRGQGSAEAGPRPHTDQR
jgi:hypothetical protein